MAEKFRFSQQEIQQNPYKSQSLSYISNKYPKKEKLLGKLLILLSFDESVDNDKFERFLTELENIYYQHQIEEGILSLRQLEQIFEQSLKKFNQQFTWLCQSKHLNIDFKKINILVAVIRDNNLLFSQVNRMDLFITYLSKENTVKIINIAEPADSRTPMPSSMKLFANLISGDLASTDSLLITNKNLSKYLSLYKLKNLLLYPNSRSINQEITKNIRQISNSENFAWLLVKREEITEAEMKAYAEKLEDEDLSDEDENENEEKSKKENNKSVGNFWKNSKQKMQSWRQNWQKEQKKQNLKQNVFDETIEINFGSKMKKMLTTLPFAPNSKSTSHYALSWHQKVRKWIKDIITYPWFIRFGLVFILILIAGFAYGTFYIKNEQELQLAQDDHNTKVEAIRTDLVNARAQFAYGNKVETEEAYYSLIEKLNDLEKDNLTIESEITPLEEDLQLLYKDLYNIVEIKDWNTISDLNNFVVDKIKYEKFNLLDNEIISFGGKTKLMLKTNLNNGQSEFIENTSDLIENIELSITLEDDSNNLFFLTKSQEILQWNKDNNLLESLEVLMPEDMKATAVAAYGKNLYFVDPNNKQIQKFTRTTSGFSKGKPWIMDADMPNLNNAVDIAIDSNIYILYNDGHVDQYFSGKKEKSFNLDNVSPKLENSDRIITNEYLPLIYIFDKKSKRLIVLDKNAVFQKQYQLTLDGEIQDIFIEDQSLFILSDNKILEQSL